jgi:signal transduction histidine kinase
MAMARDDELREVLLNLLENARLAGATAVTSRLTREDGKVRIAVVDDGQGMSPEVLPRIFQPHFSTRTSGSGLGLAISRRMIDGWGGSIGATSAVGEGTTMTIELVAAPAPGPLDP